MSIQTESDVLAFGIEHDGQVHTEFELRLPTVGDNIEAIEATGGKSGMRVSVYMLAGTLVRLGSIPCDVITGPWLEQHLVDDDYDIMVAAQARLKKKRKLPRPDSETSAAQLSSSAATATASATSGQ